MMRTRALAVGLGLLLTVALGLGSAWAQAPAPQRGGTLRVGVTQEFLNLDPHVATAFSSVQIFDLVYETLLRYNPKTLEIEPNLAQSWTVSDNGLDYTLTLRRNAVFHDGSQVDASDVKYTIERILNPATRSPLASFFQPVREVTVVSPFVVRISLRQASASFPSVLAGRGRIVPAEFEDKVGDPRVRTIGSGPYRLAEFSAGAVRLVRHERYWGRDAAGERLPYADGVVFRVIPDAATLRAALRAGELELIIGFGVDITAVRALGGVAELRVLAAPDLAYSLLGLQNERGPLSDVRVRQALSMAINRDQLIQVVYSGRATAAGPIPPTATEWRPIRAGQLPNYPPDAARARALLAQAGHAQGVAIKMMPIPTVPEAVQMAQVLREQLAPAGFRVEIEQVDFATFLNRWRGSDFDTFVSLNGGDPDPDVHLYRHIHSTGSTNVFKFKNAAIDQLLDQGRVTVAPARRQQIYGQVQRLIAEQVPFIFLAYADLFAVTRANVTGFILSSTRSMTPLAETWLSR
jgi:peptide/nickel transport system substrate-binding protein